MKVKFAQFRDTVGQWLHRLAQRVGSKSYGGPTLSARVTVETPNIRPEEPSVESTRPYAHDWLGFEEFGAGLSRLTQYGSASGVVLVDGRWGSGKTTFVQMWASSMRNEGRTVLELNAWTGDYADSPFDDIVKQLGRALREQNKGLRRLVVATIGMTTSLLSWAHGLKALKGLVEWLDPSATAPLAKVIWALHKVVGVARKRERRMNRLKNRLTAAARYHRRRWRKSVVIVIDELDRCRPDYALRFLETIKHVFEVPYVTFIVAANAEELANAVNGVYGSSFNGRGYIERFFDIRLPLPMGDRANFVKRCLERGSFTRAAAKDVAFDVGTYSGSADGVTAPLLHASALSCRQIKKAVKHIEIALLINRSDDQELASAVVFLGLVRHIAPRAYETMGDGANDEQVSERLLGALEGLGADDGTATMARELVGWLRRNESRCNAARRALDSISPRGESG